MAVQETENKSKKRNQDFILDGLKVCCPWIPENKVKPEKNSKNGDVDDGKDCVDSNERVPRPVVTCLTEREIYNFEKIWKLVQKHLPEIGKNVFVRLFSEHPLASGYFDKFRGLEGPQLLNSVALEVHGMVVMNTVDEIVSHLDEGPELIRDVLKELGESHAKFGSQLRAEDFWNIEEALVDAIDQNLGGLKQNATRLLKKTVRFLITGIVEGYEEEVKRSRALATERAKSDMMLTSHSIPHKKPDLSEMIEKDMEEKIHQNEILHHKNHHHHHRHHHHQHHHRHHHHRKHSGTHRSIATSLNVVEDWVIPSDPESSALHSTTTTQSNTSPTSRTIVSQPQKSKIVCIEDDDQP